MMALDLSQLAQALGGGGGRYYTAPQAATAGPVLSPQTTAGFSNALLANSLSGQQPHTIGGGIFEAAKALANAMVSNSEKEKAKADQQKITDAARAMLGGATTGSADLSQLPTIPDASAPVADQANAMGLNRPVGPLTTPASMDPKGQLAQLIGGVIDMGKPEAAINLMGSDITAQRAAKTKAAEMMTGLKFDLIKQENKGSIDRRNQTLTPEAQAQRVAQNAARSAATVGLQPGEGGKFEPIPGYREAIASKAEAEKSGDINAMKQKEMPAAQMGIKMVNLQQQNVQSKIDQAISQINGMSAGFLGQQLSKIGGTEATDLKATLTTIGASVGLDELANLKAVAGTGLGSVTEAEHRLLQSKIDAINQDQSPQQLRENLLSLKKSLTKMAVERNAAFQSAYKDFLPKPEAGGNDPLGIR